MKSPIRRFLFTALVIAFVAIIGIGTASAYTGTYNRWSAVNFAHNNCWNYDLPGSSYFKDNGGDCTNFVSRCLYAGGWPQVSTNSNPALRWYYNSMSSRAPSWTGVIPFREFVIGSKRGTEYVFSKGSYTLPTSVPIQDGDIIQMDWTNDGHWDHSTIVTNLACQIDPPYNSMIWVTAHSDSHYDYSLKDCLQNNPNVRFRVLLLKDTYSF
jgi:hypothetical protein